MKTMTSNTFKFPLWGKGVLLILSIIGAIAIFQILTKGHILTNATQNVPWGILVASYIYFIGLSAGGFLLSSLVYVFKLKQFEAVGHVALIQAFICMMIAGFFIMIDLGHPSRMYNVLFSMNKSSVMAWMGLFYCAYLTVIAIEMYFSMKNRYMINKTGVGLPEHTLTKYKNILFWLGLIGVPIAMGVHGGVGTIFAVAKARPNWFGGLFPIVFIISALASGGGLLTFLSGLLVDLKEDAKAILLKNILMVSIGFLVFDYLMLCAEMLTSFYGGIPEDTMAWKEMLFGRYWYTFWFLQVGVGIVFPIYVAIKKSDSALWLRTAGLCIALGIFGTRLNIVMPAQFAETLEGMSHAYNHFRFSLGYYPSVTEVMLVFAGIAIFIWLMLGANKYLPFNADKH